MPRSSSEQIKRITLTNGNLMQVTLSNYGARILSIIVPNKDQQLIETTLNYDKDEDILNDDFYMGATCGRVGNRIANAKYIHNGRQVTLNNNEGKNILHGGAQSFSHRFWSMAAPKTENERSSVTFTLFSADGDQGFPGNLTATVTYTLTKLNTLIIDYAASCDALCPINMCNHAYFHLGEKSIHELELQVNADKYTPINEQNIPTGEFADTLGAFDFSQLQKLADKLILRDFDECFLVNQSHNARLISRKNGLILDIHSDQLGLQVYSGNFLPVKHNAIALEAQGLIDAVNQANFKDEWVGPKHGYNKTIRYEFASI